MRLSTFFTGLLLVLAGTVLFLLNLGYGSGRMVIHLLRWWPVLLIIAGLCLLWRGKIPRLLGLGIAVVLTSVLVVFFLLQQPSLPKPTTEEQFRISRSEYPGLSSARLEISFGGGELSLGANTRQWLEARFTGSAADTRISRKNHHLQVDLAQKGTPRRFQRLDENIVWAINLHPELSWNLSVKAGAVKSRLNLMGVKLDELNLASGAGDLDIILGDNGAYTPVRIEAGASNIKVRVPENAGIQVRLRGALTNTNLPELGWLFGDKKYRSANYEEAEQRFDLNIDLAVGRFELEKISSERREARRGP